jgi:hypothetical protein
MITVLSAAPASSVAVVMRASVAVSALLHLPLKIFADRRDTLVEGSGRDIDDRHRKS